MGAPEPGAARRGHRARTVLAMAWFSAMFFALGPWLALRASGSDAAARLRDAPGVAWILVVAGAALVARVVARFVRLGDGTPVPVDPPRRFVQSGLWAISRNPMYLSYVALVGCEALLLRSWAVALYGLAFFALIHVYVVAVEEPGLRRRFGDAYARYCAEVPRWLSARSVRRALAPSSR